MKRLWLVFGMLLCSANWVNHAWAQSFGVELHNTLMPASGAMGGVSIARPQDLVSAINANPATLSQFRGTQFLFGGAWAEPTFNLYQNGSIPFGDPDPLLESFSAKSTAPGSPGANVGITQDLSELGLPATIGVGFVTSAGGMVDFRHVPASHGTASGLTVFNAPVGLGVDLTERWSVGASAALGIALFNAPFVEVSSMTPGYALRGTLGTSYLLTDATTVGAYYQTKQSYTFDNAFIYLPGPAQVVSNVDMDLPQNVGLGVANNALLDGRLLVGVDVLYKLWNQADLYAPIYNNQWVMQFGTQYSAGNYRLRAGYVWAQDPLDNSPGSNIGGVVQPGAMAAVRYTQGLMAITSQHRLSFGIGVVDVLPGIDLDMMAGGMFRDHAQLGEYTATSIESYWLGGGLTWRFGRGACEKLSAPDSWCSGS